MRWKSEEGKEGGNSVAKAWTSVSKPLKFTHAGWELMWSAVICFSSFSSESMFKSRITPGLGSHDYVWGRGRGGGTSLPEMPRTIGLLVRCARLINSRLEKCPSYSHPMACPIIKLIWKGEKKSMIVTCPLRGNSKLVVCPPPLLTKRVQPTSCGKKFWASIWSNIINYFTKDKMFIPLCIVLIDPVGLSLVCL